MADPLKLKLTADQRAELQAVRDHAPAPYLRERAAALLKIAEGASGRETAQRLLLRPHAPDTIYEWVNRYQADGVVGLRIKAGRGRKPAYSPHCCDAASAQETLLHTLHQSPSQLGQTGSRWQLSSLLRACSWLKLGTVAGLSQLLKRLKVHWKRARQHVHSPDLAYVDKLRSVRVNLLLTCPEPDCRGFLFEDEFTFYRQPRLGWAYEAAGVRQPLAELGHKGNYAWRIAAALNAHTGQVTYAQAQHFDRPHLVKFYQSLPTTYPTPPVIYLAQDNWPIHFHPDVLAALQPQNHSWPTHLPANWPTEPTAQARFLNLPIQILSLPTYASWTNPIEKLWRLLSQELLLLHAFEDDWEALKAAVTHFLDQFRSPSPELLRYVGLADPYKLYAPLFPEGLRY
jgi:transposase